MQNGLSYIPSHKKLKKAYHALLFPKAPYDLESLALYSQWSRFDPRLSEIWVEYLVKYWKEILPMKFRLIIKKQPWPGVVSVLLEFAHRALHLKFGKEESKLFNYWKKLVTHKLDKGKEEQFFIGLRQLGGQSAFEDAIFSLKEYSLHGYLGREVLILNATKQNQTNRISSHSSHTRKQILKSLLKTNMRITTRIYWEAISRSVSLRQAERDLSESKFLTSHGQTRGKFFQKKSY